MATEKRPHGVNPHGVNPEDVRNPEAHYERREANARGILLAGVTMIVIAVLLHFFLVGLFKTFRRNYAVRDVNPTPSATCTSCASRKTPSWKPTAGLTKAPASCASRSRARCNWPPRKAFRV